MMCGAAMRWSASFGLSFEVCLTSRFFQAEIERAEMKFQGVDHALDTLAPDTAGISEMEGDLEQFERELKELNTNDENLKRQELELTELRAILKNSSTFFEEADHHVSQARGHGDGDHEALLTSADGDRGSQLGYVPSSVCVHPQLCDWCHCT